MLKRKKIDRLLVSKCVLLYCLTDSYTLLLYSMTYGYKLNYTSRVYS